MRGSLRQRSEGAWELRVYVGVDPETGQRIDRSMTLRGSRADAERELAAMVAAVEATRAVGVRSTVGELLEAWFAVAEVGWAPTTIRQTRSVLDRYLHPHLGETRVGDVTPAAIDCVYVHLHHGGGRSGQPLAPGTLARIHVVLRSAFSQAMRWGWIWDNPAERAHRITTTTNEPRPPTPDELQVLLRRVATRDPQLHTFLVLASVTGARRAQLLGLRWHNVDTRSYRLSFCDGWVEGPNGHVLATTKTRRRHVVDLDPDSFAVLAAHARRAASSRGGFVFSDDGGHTAWKPNRVTKAFLRHRRAAGLRSFRLHDLRHFMATQMLHAGVPLVTVSRRLDHRRVSTTLDHYAHAIPGADAHASATLWRLLEAPPGTQGLPST
jgi:integrase